MPFGWGLSYTNWSYAVEQPPTTVSLEPLAALINETTAADYLFPQVQRQTQVENSSGWPAQATFHVKVTNTGSRDADDVVLGLAPLSQHRVEVLVEPLALGGHRALPVPGAGQPRTLTIAGRPPRPAQA